MEGGKDDHLFFSRITQNWEPIPFYSNLLKKLKVYAQAIDRCPRHSRELVWNQVFYLYNQPQRTCGDLFMPAIEGWCKNPSIDLYAVETMYCSFMNTLSQYPNLLGDVSPPSPTRSLSPASFSSFSPSSSSPSPSSSPAPGHPHHHHPPPLSLSCDAYPPSSFPSCTSPTSDTNNTNNNYRAREGEEGLTNKGKPIFLNNTSLIWGSDFSAAVQQFALLLHWAPLLEKLPPNQKEAIWNTCQFFPLFNPEVYERTSFRKTFLKWASNPSLHIDHIVVLFGAIGFLKDKGVIKHQFFFPNTTVPVFNNGVRRDQNLMQMRTQQMALSPSTPPSPHSYHESESSSKQPTHEYFNNNANRTQSPSPASFTNPFYSSPSPSSSSSSASRTQSPPTPAIPFPFPTSSNAPTTASSAPSILAPFTEFNKSSSPSSPTPLPLPLLQSPKSENNINNNNNTNNQVTPPSQLGLLALVAIADEQDGADIIPPKKNNNNNNNNINENNNTNDTIVNSNDNNNLTLRLPTINPLSFPPNFFQTQYNNNTTTMLSPTSQNKRAHKRKSSCGEYEEETKKPRAMNLSHILCS